MYVIAQSTGKGFIERSRKFTISGYGGNVWVLADNAHAQQWAEEQELFNDARIVDRATAQAAINEGTDEFDFHGNPQTPFQL